MVEAHPKQLTLRSQCANPNLLPIFFLGGCMLLKPAKIARVLTILSVIGLFPVCYAKILSGPDFVSFSRDRCRNGNQRVKLKVDAQDIAAD